MKAIAKRWSILATLVLALAPGLNAQTFSNLYSFSSLNNSTNSNGANPAASLILSGSTLYGTATGGGTNGSGTVFAINTNGMGFTNLHSFAQNDGDNPAAGLILSGSTLYGTATGGGTNGDGTVFAININGTGFRIVHSCTGGNDSSPGGLILSGNTLYGVTSGAGSRGYSGGVFAINTNGTDFRNLYSFTEAIPSNPTNSDGANPNGALILLGNILYGTAAGGGTNGDGTVFKVNIDGTGFTNMHNFTYDVDGYSPRTLILLGNTLYGMAGGGGTNGYGTIFTISINGSGFTNIYNFTGGNDGSYPSSGGLIFSGDTLYGTAYSGGVWGRGSMFAINTNGTCFTNLFSFAPGAEIPINPYTYTNSSGASPEGGLILSANTLYGTAYFGSTNGYGTVFSLSLGGPYIQYSANPSNGVVPLAVQFTSPGVDSGSNAITSWNWNFGDGSTSTNQNPSHIYTNTGNFSPGLIATNNLGSPVPGSGPAIMVSYPTIQYTANPTTGVVPFGVQFTSPAIDSGGNPITQWNWNFGDGSTSTAQNPSHIYNTPAYFSPILIATNNLGIMVLGSGPPIGIPGNYAYFATVDLSTGSYYNLTNDGTSIEVLDVTLPASQFTLNFGQSISGIILFTNNESVVMTNNTGTNAEFVSFGFDQTSDNPMVLCGYSIQLLGVSGQLSSPNPSTGDSASEYPSDPFLGAYVYPVTSSSASFGGFAFSMTNLYNVTVVLSAPSMGFQGGANDISVGTSSVPVLPVGVPQPYIVGISSSGTNLVINGAYGVSGATYYVLMSTNLALPFNQWIPVATNVLSAGGNFTITATNVVNPSVPQRYYILEAQ